MLSSIELALIFNRLPGAAAATYWKLLSNCHSLENVFSESPSVLSHILKEPALSVIESVQKRGKNSEAAQQALREKEWCDENQITLLMAGKEKYPKLLCEINRAPPLLFIRGNVDVLELPQLAIVGSRNCSPLGLKTAYEFSRFLVSNGMSVTSGLALGVDTSAHDGALAGCADNNGEGAASTIAVMGSGIDNVYPARNRRLAEAIIEQGGAVVSEFPLGTSPQPSNFPQRNRVISGLSYGTLVVEAAVKSGSLITARFAAQQNREVFAIPGSIHNPLSRGCHALIKDGAKLVETGQDIVDELQGFLLRDRTINSTQEFHFNDAVASGFNADKEKTVKRQTKKKPVKTIKQNVPAAASEDVLIESEKAVLDQLGFESTTVDELVARTCLAVAELMATLLSLELKGYIANLGTGYMRVK